MRLYAVLKLGRLTTISAGIFDTSYAGLRLHSSSLLVTRAGRIITAGPHMA